MHGDVVLKPEASTQAHRTTSVGLASTWSARTLHVQFFDPAGNLRKRKRCEGDSSVGKLPAENVALRFIEQRLN